MAGMKKKHPREVLSQGEQGSCVWGKEIESVWVWRRVVRIGGVRGDGGETGRFPRMVYGEKKGLSKEAFA